MERIGVDLVTLPKSWPLHNRFLFTAIEYASRYGFAYPLPSKHSAYVASALAHLFSTIGVPQILQTDQGSEFLGTPVQSLLRKYDVVHRVGSAYKPNSGGAIERLNNW